MKSEPFEPSYKTHIILVSIMKCSSIHEGGSGAK